MVDPVTSIFNHSHSHRGGMGGEGLGLLIGLSPAHHTNSSHKSLHSQLYFAFLRPEGARFARGLMKFCSLVLVFMHMCAVSAYLTGPRFATRSKTFSTRIQAAGEFGASSTSFYTDTVKQDSYDDLDTVLDKHCKDANTRQVICELLDACGEITEALRTALVTVADSTNTFGDTQLSVDMVADQIMWDTCAKSKVIRQGASEEDPIIKDFDDSKVIESVCEKLTMD